MLSTTSQPAQFTPHYVAELTETQSLIADIPPLVKKKKHYKTSCNLANIFEPVGTSCIQQRNPNNRWIIGSARN